MNTSLQIQQQQQQNHQQLLQQQQQQQQQQSQQDDQKINYFPHVQLLSGLQEEVRNRPFVCNICNATYKTRTHLRRHMFVHMTNRPYPCPDCGKGFNRKEHLNKHQDAVHSGTKYECGFCGKEISRKDHLNRHIKNMHSSLCLNNGSINGNSIGVNGEIKMEPHHQQQSITLPHQNNMIKVNLPFKQKTTQLNFLTANGIQVQQQQQNIKMKPNKQTSSRTKQQLQLQYQQVIHVQSMHPQQQQQSNHQIKTEMNVDNSLMEKKLLFQVFNCNECSATFTTEKDFNTHSRTHKPQPYKCLECPRAYTRREKLTEHIRCFHEGQKFTCDYCNKSLSRKDHVLRHVRSVHPEVLASRFVTMAEDMDAQSRLLNYPTTTSSSSSTSTTTNTQQAAALGEMNILLRSVCHICLKVFGTSYHLSRHMESCHNGDLRPYSCNSCSKQFKRKDHLSKHQKSHCPSTKSLKMTEIDSTEIESNVMNSLQILMSCPDEDIHNEGQKHSNLADLNDLMSSSPTTNNGSKCNNNNNNSSGNTSIKMDELLQVSHVDPSLNSTNLSNLMSCNYCQKEFTNRERFILHLQDHQHNDSMV